MSTIRFQPVCAADWASRAIAWYGCGYHGWSHIDCVLPDGRLIGARSDAMDVDGVVYAPGVQVRPPHYERWIRRARLTLEVTHAQAGAWERWLLSERGHQYDSDAIWGFVLGRRTASRGHWICSALACASLERIHALPKLPDPPSQVTPDAFVLLACAMGARFKEESC